MSLKEESYQLNFGADFLNISLNPKHELVILADRVDWDTLVSQLRPLFKKRGRKTKRIRLMVGLLLLKHLYDLSDRQVVSMLSENIYFRHFCGVQWNVSECLAVNVLDSSTLTKFRQRIGKEGLTIIENLIKTQLHAEGRISKKAQLVDTTAQPKNIAYPTDSNLLARGIGRLVKAIKRLKLLGLSVEVRSHKRLVRKEILRINKLGRGRKERIAEGTKKLAQYAKRVRKSAQTAQQAIKVGASERAQRKIDKLKKQLTEDSELTDRVIRQAEARLNGEKIPVQEKVFSFHEPHTTVIAKGKRPNRYEFGSKVCLSSDRNQYIVGHQEYSYNLADVNALDPAVEDWERTFGDVPDELGADRGFHARDYSDRVSKIRRLAIQAKGSKPHPDHKKAHFRRLQRWRNCIEPAIGHLKTDHRVNRCRYSGELGDSLNMGLASAAWNLRKWARQIRSEMEKAEKQVA